MTNPKKLLVLMDGSERSGQTVKFMEQLTPFKNDRIILFTVFSGIPQCYRDLEKTPQYSHVMSQMTAWEVTQKRRITEFMENARERLVAAGYKKDAVDIQIHNQRIGIARDILKEAEEGAYKAVVMRRRGAGALETIVVGSVANKLLGKLTCCPLIIAGRRELNNRVLLAVDGSTASFKAVDFVAETLGGLGYSVGLLHVIRGFGNLVPENPEFMMPSESVELAHDEMMRLFGDIREKLILAGFDENHIEEKIITGINSRAGAIVEEAKAGNYGTIVVGRKGLSRVQEFFMGRVSTKVIHVGREFTVWMV